MSMADWFLVYFCGLLGATILGALVSLWILLRPIRAAARRRQRVRRTLVAYCGLLGLAVAFGLVTRILAEGTWLVFSAQIDSIRDQLATGSQAASLVDRWDRNRGGIVVEFWLRQMTPPDQAPRCLSVRLDVCNLLNDQLGLIGGSTWGFYALFISFALVSALTSASFAWWCTSEAAP